MRLKILTLVPIFVSLWVALPASRAVQQQSETPADTPAQPATQKPAPKAGSDSGKPKQDQKSPQKKKKAPPAASETKPAPAASPDEPRLLLVVGIEGAEEYESVFLKAVADWQQAANQAALPTEVIGLGRRTPQDVTDRDKLQEWLDEIPKTGDSIVWIVLIGHGSFDGRTAKFNLRGPDVSVDELEQWLKPLKRPLVFINTAPSSSAFLQKLSGPDRIVISATKSPDEIYYTRFGSFYADAIGGKPEADLDNDGQVSVLEAFIHASNQVIDFYAGEGRLATEHALIDDNGDRLGTRAEWFEGVRAVKKPSDNAEADGFRAQQVHLVPNALEALMPPALKAERDDLERQVRDLVNRREDLEDAAYYAKLEDLFLKIARIYEQVDNAESSPGPPASEKPNPKQKESPKEASPSAPATPSDSPPDPRAQ